MGTTLFPAELDALAAIGPNANEMLDAGLEHDVVHDDLHTILMAMQAKIGVDGSLVATSIDFRLGAVESGKIDSTEKGVAGGVATLGVDGKVPVGQLSAIALTEVYVVASEAEQVALVAQVGDVAIRSDLSRSYVHNGGTAGTMADWFELLSPTGGVSSVAGKTGVVTLEADDIASGVFAAERIATGTLTDGHVPTIQSGALVFAAPSGGGGSAVPLHYRRDDLTAIAGNDLITLATVPYQDAVEIFRDGLLLGLADYSVLDQAYTLDAAASGGELFVVRYWTETDSPGASTLTTAGIAQTWDPLNTHASITLSSGNLNATRAASDANAWRMTVNTTSHNSGKRYFEVEMVAGSALDAGTMVGVVAPSPTLTNFVGQASTAHGVSINRAAGALVWNNGASAPVGGVAAAGEVIGIAIDFDAGKAWVRFTNPGTWSSGDPTTGASPAFTFTANATRFIAACIYNSPGQLRIRSTTGELTIAAPTGYAAWG